MKLLHTRGPRTFMGTDTSFERARAVILPVPYDSTTSWVAGARYAAEHIIEASRHLEWFDLELETNIEGKVGIYTLDELEPDTSGPEANVKRIAGVVGDILDAGKFPVTLGGEHSIAAGPLKAFAERGKPLAVLQIDAHLDSREEFEGSRWNHACVMARAREMGHEVVHVGIRSAAEEEFEFVRKSRAKVHWAWEKLDAAKVLRDLGGRDVYVTIDLDGFDPSEIPSTGTPEPGGLTWYQVTGLLRAIAEKKRIVGFDLNELAPIAGEHAADFLAAKLAYKLIGYSLLLKK